MGTGADDMVASAHAMSIGVGEVIGPMIGGFVVELLPTSPVSRPWLLTVLRRLFVVGAYVPPLTFVLFFNREFFHVSVDVEVPLPSSLICALFCIEVTCIMCVLERKKNASSPPPLTIVMFVSKINVVTCRAHSDHPRQKY